jgi:dihydroxyacid dehydratase/phosphogluconate dehydratase
VTEAAAIHAIKTGQIDAGDVMVLICSGPAGAGMQEIYQITSALKALPFGKHVAVLTDARFSGVSTGACIGHIAPEALAGGAVGKLLDGDWIENFVGDRDRLLDPEQGAEVLASRAPRPDLQPHPELPDDTRLWAALVQASGGIWGGCVYDVNAISAALIRQVV